MNVSRRTFLAATSVAVVSIQTRTAFAQNELQWSDVRDWGIEGKGFTETEKWFDRLPSKAKGVVTDAVWNLSRHSAGMLVRFETDAAEIHVDYKVTSSNLAMPHMPATGVSGLDLYGVDPTGAWKWIAVYAPKAQENQGAIISGLDGVRREYVIYLPLYNGTEHLRIGVPKSHSFKPLAPRSDKPIVFYGTSITHGACASRPGMPHPSILGRRLNRPIINLGFSGNGRMDIEVGRLLSELDAATYVIDCLPNMNAAEVKEKTAPLVNHLRSTHPETPIVLVEDRSYSGSWAIPSQKARNDSSRQALKSEYQKLLDGGVKKLHYIDGESLLGNDRDDTTDGSHPSDLGFFRHADAFEPVLRQALSN
ncbi:MAG: SGNH/GDSL hydrolase family protein [Planctomycetaceae bacterium]|nr:SGNH/GDSL hydrolase family protein [Planctomycetaceae bacterium]